MLYNLISFENMSNQVPSSTWYETTYHVQRAFPPIFDTFLHRQMTPYDLPDTFLSTTQNQNIKMV